MPRPLIQVILFISFTTLASLSIRAQEFIGKNKTSLVDKLNKQAGKSMAVSTKDSLLIISYSNDAGSFQKILSFDEAGNCKAEKYLTASADNYKVLLESLIAEKKFEWKKLNENQYVSRFKDQLMIELPVKKDDHSFTVFYAGWTPELYKMLTGN